MGQLSLSLLIFFTDCGVLSQGRSRHCFRYQGTVLCSLFLLPPPLPTSFLSSFFTWKKVRWLLAVLQGCPVHKDGDATSVRELRRQGDKLAEILHLPPGIFRLHLASVSQVLPTLKLPTLVQEWAH